MFYYTPGVPARQGSRHALGKAGAGAACDDAVCHDSPARGIGATTVTMPAYALDSPARAGSATARRRDANSRPSRHVIPASS
ncbi:MAG: hypothetical protein AVDCRST_MAG18-2917 [uncultured Thermomicrobiales bacterium]|uniref:Uncharacterized protein n=1 Tax=uncultured Thermomicrobiales bacterium TaxID=1645740 RepID=A0A6J4VJJ2_9BACT|nr:MAG: hypothetical protein AVDCRST_MAG18-2917 [uncultured Thermomicrobiales bacterium]